ncbi:MAG: type II toxin-antitoxin system Phd/YefM family antitoxin [Gammaproteobacteria bacterium]
MKQVKVTEFRAHLPEYLSKVQSGETFTVMSRGHAIARLVPATGVVERARERLVALRKRARVGDIVSPVGVEWTATRART